MPDTIVCSNTECRAIIETKGKEIGETVECPKCGTPNQVLVDLGSAFDISSIELPKEGGKVYHPARQLCSNCGAVLGVRETFCPKCHADIRTGTVVIPPAPEEKKRRRAGPLLIIAGVVGLIVLVVLVIVVLSMLS